jgi:hypothetical protein
MGQLLEGDGNKPGRDKFKGQARSFTALSCRKGFFGNESPSCLNKSAINGRIKIPYDSKEIVSLCKKFWKAEEGSGGREENLFQKVSSLPPEYLSF